MANGKDWVKETAQHIWTVSWQHAGLVPPEKRIAFIIEQHCPFQKDVAYMPVPRCDGCKWWGQPVRTMEGEGACTKMNAIYKGNDNLLLVTRANFGCVKGEAKT